MNEGRARHWRLLRRPLDLLWARPSVSLGGLFLTRTVRRRHRPRFVYSNWITVQVRTLGDPSAGSGQSNGNLNVRVGSSFPLIALTESCPKLGVKQSKSATTSAFGGKLPVVKRSLARQCVAKPRHSGTLPSRLMASHVPPPKILANQEPSTQDHGGQTWSELLLIWASTPLATPSPGRRRVAAAKLRGF
jgi:hypothetical protein